MQLLPGLTLGVFLLPIGQFLKETQPNKPSFPRFPLGFLGGDVPVALLLFPLPLSVLENSC